MRPVLKIMPLLMLLAAVFACENPATATTAELLAALPDPAAKFAYGIISDNTWTGGGIRSFSVSRNGLIPFESISIPAVLSEIVVHPSMNALYVTGRAYSSGKSVGYIYQYVVGNDGRLSAMTTPSVAAGDIPIKLVIHPSGNFAYMIGVIDRQMYLFTISATGVFSSPVLVSEESYLYDIVIDHSGKYLYTTGYDTVYQYSINADGTLAPMTPATAAGSGQMIGLVVDPMDKFFYAANASGNAMLQYTIGATGGLAAMNPASLASSGNTPLTSAIRLDGYVLYVMSGDGIERFSIAPTGALSSIQMLSVAGDLRRMSIDSTGDYAFVVQQADTENNIPGKVHQYGIIDPAGTLESLPTASISVPGLRDFVLYQ